MPPKDQVIDQDSELNAMGTVYAALRALDEEAQIRVLEYVTRRLGLNSRFGSSLQREQRSHVQTEKTADDQPQSVQRQESPVETSVAEQGTGGVEGVSPVAQKWIRRNGFSETQLSSLFSLGVDEIDLVATSMPGKSVREKFRSVLLLQGVASYLGSGVARVEYEKLRQAAGHYGADPGKNLWNCMKSLSSEASGSSTTGFTLTARGMNAATELVKKITSQKSDK